MKIEVRNRCSDFNSYRAARVKSLFNAESGTNFDLDAELPLEGREWKIGVIVGPSGSGKTSIGEKIWGPRAIHRTRGWPKDAPIIDAIAPAAGFDDVTGALSAVGLGTVPAWLRPFHALSNGEQFRANLARVIMEAPTRVVIDEFTSVVDRQIARFGALAFAKAWRRTAGQCVLLTPHYDVLPWIQPDWVFDTGTGQFTGRYLRRRPPFELVIQQTDGSYWPRFEPHHYLKLPRMIAARYFVGTVGGELVAHVAFSPRFNIGGFRACRLVVMPEWQGAGVGTRFLDSVCQLHLDGENKWRRSYPTYFHTSHPGLAAALRRSARWVQVSARLYGNHKARSLASMERSAARKGGGLTGAGFGGHFRAVQGFKYVGDA